MINFVAVGSACYTVSLVTWLHCTLCNIVDQKFVHTHTVSSTNILKQVNVKALFC